VLATPFLWDGTASSELRDPMLDDRDDLPDGEGLFGA